MQKDLQKISDHWEEIYSRQVRKYQPFKMSSEFKKLVSMFAPGDSYLYIVNLHNFELEYISDSVVRFVNKAPGKIDLRDLLQTVVSEDLENLHLRSKVISDFYTCFLHKEDVLDYKNTFTYRMMNASGQIRTMLYQAFPLSVLENGTPEHVLCIQTDVSHLKITRMSSVSFINMNGGNSYFNVDISAGKFDPAACANDDNDLSGLITEREKQIIIRLARGLNAEEIATDLNLSHHTIKTHRRNVLQKSGCTNTTELVAKCLTYGIISPDLQVY